MMMGQNAGGGMGGGMPGGGMPPADTRPPREKYVT